MVEVRVECYAGYRGEETPRRLFLGGRVIEVEAVIGRRQTPNCRYFEVRGNDGCRYTIRHDPAADRWDMVSLDAG